MEPAITSADNPFDDNAPTLRKSGIRERRRPVPTAADAMRQEEEDRTRGFLRIAVGYALCVALASMLVRAPLAHRLTLYAGIMVGAGGCVWLIARMRQPGGYTPARALSTGLGCLFGALSGVVFFGAFSPAAVVLPFGLYFFALGRSVPAINALAAVAGVGYALLAAAELGGVLAGGVVAAGSVSFDNRLVMVLLVEATILATYLTARASRQATQVAVARQLDLATQLARREALLAETRRDLQHALARSNVGRFSDELAGSFRLGAVIGRGAMGEVYEASDADGREAAVKLLKPELIADPLVVRRFLREVKVAATLDIPFVARVYEVGDVHSEPAPYIAMERLRGESLADILARRGRLPLDELMQLLREVGCALDAAHASGVVHRDIKPTNLFLHRGGAPATKPMWKVLDFGVAKLTATRGTLTAGLIVGTPAYMAPEQAGGKVSAASDLFALGVIAYRALTGQAPFGGSGWADTIYSIATSMPARPSELAAVPEDVDAVLAIAMAKDPSDRFRSAHCFAKALEVALRGELDDATLDRAWHVMRKHPWRCDARSIPPSSVRGG